MKSLAQLNIDYSVLNLKYRSFLLPVVYRFLFMHWTISVVYHFFSMCWNTFQKPFSCHIAYDLSQILQQSIWIPWTQTWKKCEWLWGLLKCITSPFYLPFSSPHLIFSAVHYYLSSHHLSSAIWSCAHPSLFFFFCHFNLLSICTWFNSFYLTLSPHG